MNARIIHDITKFIFVQDEIVESDIIFIPGGSHPELGEHAADLYKRGFARLVMPSGGVSVKTGKFSGVKSKTEIYNKTYSTDCEFLADVLSINGVPDKSVIWENESGHTKGNAAFSRKVADEKGLEIARAIICCKCFHARRSLMAYQFAFPDADFRVYPVPYFEGGVEISAESWHKSAIGIARVLGEVQRCGNQFNDDFYGLLSKMEE